MTNTDFIITIPAAEYHAASKAGEFMSSHLLADFRESPALYRKEILGEIEDTESPALALGRAAQDWMSNSAKFLTLPLFH